MRYVIANWKMHTTVDEAAALFVAVQDGLRVRRRRGAPVPRPIICPPFVSLAPLLAMADPGLVALGAQNCHWEREGPFTGEVSPAMLRGLAEYVLLGHSERRAAGDTDELIARKVAAASACGLVPIVFVGEDREGDDAVACSDERLRLALSRIDVSVQRVVVVYEPAWAIGADEPADADHVSFVARHLKERLRSLGSPSPEIVYGGTVSDGNIDSFTSVGVLDGVGATRAALDPGRFLAMVDHVAAAHEAGAGPARRPEPGTTNPVRAANGPGGTPGSAGRGPDG